MKRLLPPTLFAACGLLLLALVGCPSAPPVPKTDPMKQQQGKRPDALRFGVDLLRGGTDPAHFRDGLQLVNAEFQTADRQAKLLLAEDGRKFLKDTVGLSSEELAEVESTSVRPADAYHVAGCSLLRDAARAIEVPGQPPADQARRAFEWVVRHVVPHETSDEWLPADYVLRRGSGAARDRGLAFVELLRQLHVDACVLVLPSGPEVVLVGAASKDGADLYRFDPRLGLPVLSGDKVATLTDVRTDPKLLAPSNLTADQVKSVEARALLPLYALSPRMAELERLLSVQDRIVLHADGPRHLAALARAAPGLKVEVWNRPAEGGSAENSPTRALRHLLPADEGGVDKAGRLAGFEPSLIPLTQIFDQFDQINLTQALAAPGRERLIALTADLFKKFYLQPTESVLRGDYDRAAARLDRVRGFVNDDALADLAGDEAFQKDVAEWREKLNTAYREMLRDPKAQGPVNALWAEDQYFLSLLQVDSEERPETRTKEAKGRPVLTRVMAHGTREALGQRVAWLQALAWHEKAARAQAFLDLPAKDSPAALAAAANAWNNAAINWNLYVGRMNFYPGALAQRLAPVREKARVPGGLPVAVNLLQQLHADVHHYFAAKLNRAEALRSSKPAEADALLKGTLAELDELKKAGVLRGEVEQLQRGAPAPLARPLELLARAWDDGGAFDHLRRRLARRLG